GPAAPAGRIMLENVKFCACRIDGSWPWSPVAPEPMYRTWARRNFSPALVWKARVSQSSLRVSRVAMVESINASRSVLAAVGFSVDIVEPPDRWVKKGDGLNHAVVTPGALRAAVRASRGVPPRPRAR